MRYALLVLLSGLLLAAPPAAAHAPLAKTKLEGKSLSERHRLLHRAEQHHASVIRWCRKHRHASRACTWHRRAAGWTAKSLEVVHAAMRPRYSSPNAIADAIYRAFLPFGAGVAATMVAVAGCESNFDPAAANGQYLGLLQMGASERATYGHGGAQEQIAAAVRIFRARGFGPWRGFGCL